MLLQREKLLELIRWQPDPIDLELLVQRLRGLASAPVRLPPEISRPKSAVRPIVDAVAQELTEYLATAADRVAPTELDRWKGCISRQIRWLLASDEDRDDDIAAAIGSALREKRTAENQGYLDRLQRARYGLPRATSIGMMSTSRSHATGLG